MDKESNIENKSKICSKSSNEEMSIYEIENNILYDSIDDKELDINNDSVVHVSVISHILSQLRIGMDLTKITLPTFILERRSLLEMYADFFSHTHLITNISLLETPLERMKGVLKFYLSSFHGGRKGAQPKKPYNPILGETFQCLYKNINRNEDKNNAANGPILWAQPNDFVFISEQVSHHPPISAFYGESEKSKICFNAYLWTKSKFLGLSIAVQSIGNGILYILDHKEEYIMTFPSGYGRNILGTPWFELGGLCKIICKQTGLITEIEFLTKPFFSNKKHRIISTIYQDKKILFQLEGQWTNIINVKDDVSNIFFNANIEKLHKKYVRKINDLQDYESRKIWNNVTISLENNNLDQATNFKSEIEKNQRDKATERQNNNIEWKQKYFLKADDGWIYKNPLFKRLGIDYDWKCTFSNE